MAALLTHTNERPDGIATAALSNGSATERSIRFVTVVLPCLNEEEAVGATVQEALAGLKKAGLAGEVLVVDNGSSDASVAVACDAGARVIHEFHRGYGAAHRTGIREAHGDVVVMADADKTYDLEGLGAVVEPLRHGADMVVANRFGHALEREAMPFLHRYVGTPVITRFVRSVTRVPVRDSQSGYRAFWRSPAIELGLSTSGMEYASEMLLRAGLARWNVVEIPSTYRPRLGESKLHTFSDGWRHLKLLLVLSPHLSLLLPGVCLFVVGLAFALLASLAPAGIDIGPLRWAPIFIGPTGMIVGANAFLLGLLASRSSDFTPGRIRRMSVRLDQRGAVEWLILRFILIALGGLLIDGVLFVLWLADSSSGNLIGIAGVAQALIVIGVGGISTVLGAELARDSLTS